MSARQHDISGNKRKWDMEKLNLKNNIVPIESMVNAVVEEERKRYEMPNLISSKPTSGISSKDILAALKGNEDGDGWLLVNLQRNKFCYDHSSNQWFRWSGNYWEKDRIEEVLASIDSVVDAYAEEVKRQLAARINATKNGDEKGASKAEKFEKELLTRIHNLQTLHRKKNILRLATAGENSLGISGDEWDVDPMLLACKNGVIDLKTGEFRPGRPDDYIKTYAPSRWKGLECPAPAWEQFLLEIFDGEKELVDFMQRLLGYSISGLSVEHIMSILYGEGRNGKGTLIEVMNKVLGDLQGPIQAEMLLSQLRTRSSAAPSPDIMALRGRRIAWASETEEGRKMDIGKMKWLVGGDSLVGRNVYGKDEIEFDPTHTIFLLTNHKPQISAEDYAAWERVHLIPFLLSFIDEPHKSNERKSDKFLKDKLLVESSGILAWLMRGFLSWQENGLNPPEIIKQATKEYQEEEDVIGHFLNERCDFDPEQRVQANPLYQSYKAWCDFGGHTPLSGTKFGKRLGKKFDKVYDGRVYYKGINLKKDVIY